ncbi:adhesin, partial [Rodentibacter pneumotropicus]
MNKIFKVIWNHAAQTWVAVSELSKVKAISSSSTSTKPDSLSTNLIKTIVVTLPFVVTPTVANAYVEIPGVARSGQANPSANAKPADKASDTRVYDYKNPGNKSYHDADKKGDLSGRYSNEGEYAFGIAIGNKSDAVRKDGVSSGIAIGDYSQAKAGLATAVGAFSNAEDVGSTAIGTAARAKGFNSLAMMRQSAAIGDYSAAIGSVAYAKGNASFAFGASATSNGNQSIAIGNVAPKTLDGLPGGGDVNRTQYDGFSNTQSNGDRSVAIGSGAKTNGNDSFAFGSLASTGEFYSEHDSYLGENVTKPGSSSAEKAIAFGTSSRATGNSSIAFGYNSLGAKTNSIAFGIEAKARKNDAVAFGSNANASEANAIAFGSNAQALHENVITIGKDSKATKKGAMSIGESAISNAKNSLSLGNGTVVNQADIKNKNAKYTNDNFDIERGVVAIANKGTERRLVNLAAGREDTDAVNVKQLSEVNDNLAKSIAGDSYIGYSIDSATGRYTYKAPEFDIKNQKLNNVKKAVELAQTNYVSVNADKNKQKETNSNYDNLGAKGTGSIALGEMTGTGASAKDSIAIGRNTNVTGANTIAIGANISAGTSGSVILGDNSTTTGSHATETVASKTIGGHTYNFSGSVQDAGRFVSVGGKGKERQIKNVAAGHIEANSTDAINGSQLYAVASRIEQGWKITTDKTGSGEVSGNKEQKIAMGDTVKVIAGNNINITQNNASLTVATKENVTFTKVTSGNTTLDDKGLTIKDGPKIAKDGIDAGSKKITNVSNGTINANSKDAVNGSQLFATNQNITNNANNIANNTQNISKNTSEIAKGLNFRGDNTGVTVNRKLGETLNVTGGAAENNLSDNNIGVVGTAGSSSVQGSLAIKLAKDLKGLNSVNTKEIKLGDQTNNTTIKLDGNRIKYGDKNIANLGDEKHITKGEYAVQNDGSVTMTYTDGNGKVVTNETAKITGIAKQDLSNINNSGETKIKNLAKATINMEDGKNTKVSYRDVNDVKTFKVDVEGALANITSITNGNSSGKVEFRPDGSVNISGNNSISLNGKDGHITGLTNTDWNVTNPTPVSGRAATEDQLKTVSNVVNKIGDNNIKLGSNSGTTEEQKLSKTGGLQFNVVGGDSAKYISTTAAGTNVTIDLTKDTKDKIDNAASKSLTNITNEGKKVITGLGTVVEAGTNVVVTNTTDATTGQKTYTVSAVAQNLGDAELSYKANGANSQKVKVSQGLDFTDGNYTTATVGANGKIQYDVNVGNITTGADGKAGIDGVNGKNTVATVKTVVEAINNSGWLANATKSTGELDGTSVATKVAPSAVVNFDAGKNLTVKQDVTDPNNQTYTYSLSNDIAIGEKGEPGTPGKDGVDGKIGINGKDGSAVVINGKDGSIGLSGKDGANGLTIKGTDGKAGVDGKDGESKTRIIYETKDPKDPNKTITEEVATLNDGLKFKGDDTTVIAKKLNEQLEIVGGADKAKLTKDNIGVNSKDGKLSVQLSKDLNDIETITNGQSSVVLNKSGGTTISGGDVSVDDNKITNIKAGDVTETSTDAVNGSQLYNIQKNLTVKGLDFGAQSGDDIHKNLGEKLEIVGKGAQADDQYDATNIKTMTKDGKIVIGLAKDLTADKVTVGQKGENGKDGIDGTIGVNGKDGSSVVINGKDGSIGLNGKDGANGLTIKSADGKAGVDGKDGESKTRIVYETKDPQDPSKTITEEVATLNDGLKFKGDKGDSIAKKLNEELEILGKLNANANVTDKNLRVDNEGGKLILKMAKELQDLTSAHFIDEMTGSKSVINGRGLTITPKDAPANKTVSVTDKGLNNGGNQIVNIDSGLKDANGNKVSLTDAKGDTLNNAVNVGDLKESINNITDPSKGGGFGLMDENGNDAKAKLGETVTVKGDGSVITKVVNENGKAKLQVGLNKDVTIGNDQESGVITVKGENGQDGVSINGKDSSIGLKGADGKDGISLNGKDGTIGINGKDGSKGAITVVQGQAGLAGNDGKDGKTKTRIVYEKSNGETEEVATLNDGLRFTGNNEVVNNNKLNSVVTIKGEGIDKNASDNFESAVGNVNVKADGKGTLEVQLAKDLKNVDSISNKDGQKIEFKADGTTISGGNLSVDGNKITNVKAGEDDTDAVNVKQLKDGIAQATTKVDAGKNIEVVPTKNADGSTTYTVKTKDNVDFTSVTTGNTTMNDNGITIRASDNGKTNVILTNKGLDNGGNKVVNVADGEISSTSKDAVNGSQLHNVKQELAREGLNFRGQSGQSIHKNLGETLEIVGKGQKADTEYDAVNIKTYEENGKVVVALAKDLTANKVTVGEKGANGKDGADGSIGVNGKDGSAVVINGKDGSIGLNGKDGKNGVSIKGQDGKVGVDGKDGETRLVYVEKDHPNKTHEIATTDDGLKFTGNNEVVNNNKLNSKVTVKGEGVSKSQSENFKSAKGNINVKADGKGTLEVQLAKDIDLGNDGSVRAGN